MLVVPDFICLLLGKEGSKKIHKSCNAHDYGIDAGSIERRNSDTDTSQ